MARLIPSRAQRALVAGGAWLDLRSGEKMLSAAQARKSHARDAPGNRGRSHRRLTGVGPLREAEHRFYRASESDHPPWNSGAGSSHVGDGAAVPTLVRPPRVVACVLSFCASSRITPSCARAAARARWQTSGATLPTANTGDGSWQNPSTMDGTRGALLPFASSFYLSATQARCGCRSMLWRGR
jgi:hypothetical protein